MTAVRGRRYRRAIEALKVAAANDAAAVRASDKTRAAAERAAVSAVKAGATKYEVAKVLGISPQGCGRIAGMPKRDSAGGAA